MSSFLEKLRVPKIYAYTTPIYRDTKWLGKREGKGLLKIGYTERDVIERVREQFPTLMPEKNPFEILLEEEAIDEQGNFFTDHSIHKHLREKDFKHINGEWFECTIEDVKNSILHIKSGKTFSENRHLSFGLRPEQKDAITQTKNYFKRYSKEKEIKAPHFLWNAKMRFGKTFATYKLIEEMKLKKVLVLTYKPAVESAWKKDLESHIDFEGWKFIGGGDPYIENSIDTPLIWFSSFQDILGRTKTGEIKERFKIAYEIDWDIVVLDEYHYGAWRDTAKEFYDSDTSEKYIDVNFSEETFPLKVNHFLYLSGTPFRALTNGEFLENQIFNWTYTDEQREKENWLTSNGENPYSELPQIVLMTYQIPETVRNIADEGEYNEFDLNEFFKAKELSENNETNFVFENEQNVQQWLNLIRGAHTPANPSASKDAVKVPIPFQDKRLLGNLKHTIWFLPNVASCKAMASLLKRDENFFFFEYQIITAAGNEAGMGSDALNPVEDAIGNNPLNTRTITLSCGKLMTGVSVPAWSGIFILRNTTSPETYFQAAFRVQTPWTKTNKDGDDLLKKVIIKTTCYIFDFAPIRALNLIAEYSSRLDLNETGNVEKKVEEFIKFLPVLVYDGYKMQQLEASEILNFIATGTSSSLLANRWTSDRLINIDNYTIEKLLNSPDVLASLEKIEAFRNLTQDLSKIISSEKSLNKTKKAGKKLTDKEKSEEKDNFSIKKRIKEKLKKFITRVPVFMYLTDDREQCLKDVITQIEPDLFKSVTGLTINDFEKLCELDVFNSQVMNSAIFAFKRFEEGSLIYAGGAILSENVGGFDAVSKRTDLPNIIEGLF